MLRSFTLSAVSLALSAACTPDAPLGQDPSITQAEAPPMEDLHLEPEPAAPSGALTAQGLDALQIGMTLEQVTETAGPDSNPDAAGGPEPEVCDEFHPENAPEGVLVMIEEGVLTRISLIRDASLSTDAGLSLGAPSEDVRAAYTQVEVTPHKYQESPAIYIDVWDNVESGDQAINDPQARGIRYVVGHDGVVETIHAGGPSIRYVEGCL